MVFLGPGLLEGACSRSSIQRSTLLNAERHVRTMTTTVVFESCIDTLRAISRSPNTINRDDSYQASTHQPEDEADEAECEYSTPLTTAGGHESSWVNPETSPVEAPVVVVPVCIGVAGTARRQLRS